MVFAGNQAPYDNSLAGGGGGMMNFDSSPMLSNVVFSGNSATSPFNDHGGAIANYGQSRMLLVNVSFSRNSAALGGAMYSTDASRPIIRNSILWGDSAAKSPEIFDAKGAATDVSFSTVAGGWAGQGNRDADPRFADADGPDNIAGTLDDDLLLSAASPAIDAGDNAAVPSDGADIDGDGDTAERLPLDLDHNPRLAEGSTVGTGAGSPIVDMGAYEHQRSQPADQAPLLGLNYTTGRPGSAFLVTGNGWTPMARLRITVNGMAIGEIISDAIGAFTVTIETQPGAVAGSYQLSLTPIGSSLASHLPMVTYALDQAAPLRAKEASGYNLLVPLAASPTTQSTLYLPMVLYSSAH